MVSVAPLAGFVVAPVLAAIVYAHAARRGLGPRPRLARALAVGVVSFCGFALPYYAGDAIVRAYLTQIAAVRGAHVLVSPYEATLVHLGVGVLFSAAAALSYGLERRFAPSDGRDR